MTTHTLFGVLMTVWAISVGVAFGLGGFEAGVAVLLFPSGLAALRYLAAAGPPRE